MEPAGQADQRRLSSPKSVRTISGLGIAVEPGAIARQASYHGLIEHAAPIDGSSGQESRDPFEDGSPDLSLRSEHSGGHDDFRSSIHSAWDKGALRGVYAPLEDEREAGGGGGAAGPAGHGMERDIDAMSMDSLQMRNEDPRDGPQDHAHSNNDSDFTTTTRGLAAGDTTEYGAFRSTLDQRAEFPFRAPPTHVRIRRTSWRSFWLISTSVYSTLLSGVWLITAIVEPRWGSIVSTNGPISLSSAGVFTAIIAKTIEMSFVTVAVAFVGQVLTRRAIATHEGMTMAEVTMRTWIMQPGTVLANLRALRYVGRTLLGITCILATLVVMFYTTASDTMVRPKLQFSSWQEHTLKSTILASYANPTYVQDDCATPISSAFDADAGSSCLAVQYSGDSFSDFLTFFSTWRDTRNASTAMRERPQVQSMLYDNVTMVGTWIETQYSDVPEKYQSHHRIINNVSLAMPHPGVYKAATNRTLNGILQPSDLDGVGSYNVSASVVSPAVNVLCVNMNHTELAPLVYTTWPNALVNRTATDDQVVGWSGWELDVPAYNESAPADAAANWLNATVVDDIFRWGAQHQRRPPVFQRYPNVFNTLVNSASTEYANATDAIYILSKSNRTADYTLCGLQSWQAIQCSTRFDVSGLASMAMSVDCAQDGADDNSASAAAAAAGSSSSSSSSSSSGNPDAYVFFMPDADSYTPAPDGDWKNMVALWAVSINLNGGVESDNASNARILTELALTQPRLNTSVPSLAESLAAMVANTLVTGSINTPFVHFWDYDVAGDILAAPAEVSFHARVRSQEYASWHSEAWQGVFYPVLAFCFLLNLVCLAYLCRVGMVRDFLEPTSLFALATSRPQAASGPGQTAAAATPGSASVMGGVVTGGAGPGAKTPEMDQRPVRLDHKANMGVSYRLSYQEDGDHFYFEEAAGRGASARGTPLMGRGAASGVELEEGVGGRRTYSRLSPRFD